MLSVMSQAFSEFSDSVSELIENTNEEEFEADPYGVAEQLMVSGLEDFKKRFAKIKEETGGKPIRFITVDSIEDIDSLFEQEMIDDLEKELPPPIPKGNTNGNGGLH